MAILNVVRDIYLDPQMLPQYAIVALLFAGILGARPTGYAALRFERIKAAALWALMLPPVAGYLVVLPACRFLEQGGLGDYYVIMPFYAPHAFLLMILLIVTVVGFARSGTAPVSNSKLLMALAAHGMAFSVTAGSQLAPFWVRDMETKANHLVIGGFVLIMLGAVFAFVCWLENFMNGGSAKRYHVVFNGLVQGLAEAGSVLFNGLRVGSVKQLSIMPEDTRKVRVLIAIAKDTPVRENSRARISQQGLAGWVGLEITPGTPDSPLLKAGAGADLSIIQADISGAGGSVMSAAPEAFGNANALFIRLNELIANNQDLVHSTAKNVESFTAMLDANKEDIAAAIKDARALSTRFNTLAGKLEGVVDRVTGGDNSIVGQAQTAAASFRKLAERLDGQADGLTRQAQRGMREFELFMRDGRRLTESFDRVLQKVENNPSSLIFGGSQIPEYKPGQ